ncbi:DUF1131 family protein [Candidatus Thiothrix sp. Deng01]|uniref:DUF1131 family protein n=1 Tax=Candidatus Thiothrix phosphatis TaxID=3112415 RepID=A0ABU6D0L6_9GAMM|nr:DUF1131 family protein [Candidatus Thiothrix sp. Deng01]MEB4592620.1 DUF1131 family protein [Candidatus Thiothrix sp. Deng01]
MLKLCVKWRMVVAVSTLLAAAGCNEKAAVNTLPEVTPLEMLSVDGVGPINANTPFNLHDIGMAFQSLNVTEQTNYSEGRPYHVITVKKDIKELLTINPDAQEKKIFSVMVQDNLIGNRLGHSIGTKFRDIYAAGSTEECAAGAEELSGKTLCYAPKTGNVLYLFGGNWNGPDGSVPPKDVLADWRLEAIIWKPPARN